MRRASISLIAILGLLSIAACGGPDLNPVPTVASLPFVCDGVAREAAELILGGTVRSDRADGAWGDENGFHCELKAQSGRSGAILVTEQDVSDRFSWGGTEKEIRDALASQGNAHPIHTDVDGLGYVYDGPTAAWVCHGRIVLVVLKADVDRRDARADVENLLVSMLPWACGDEVPPKQTADE